MTDRARNHDEDDAQTEPDSAESDRNSGSSSQAQPIGLNEVIKWTETVAIPAGALTGLLVFFGSTYSKAYFGYFGISQHMLQHSIQDKLLLSADVVFGTAIRALVAILILIMLDRLLAPWRQRQDSLGRSARVLAPVLGALLFIIGTLAALRQSWLAGIPLRLAAVALLIGAAILLRAVSHEVSSLRAARVPVLATLLLGAFWVTALYAEDVGNQIARQIDTTPAHLPAVTVFSEKYLDLPGNAVISNEDLSPSGTPLYRYGGLRLLTFSNGRYFLLTGRFDGYHSTVTILPDDDDILVDLARQQ